MIEENHEAGLGTLAFGPRGVPHSYAFHTDVVRMLAIVAPGGIEQHFRDPRFAEPAGAPTLPPPPVEPPDSAFPKAMVADLAGYDTEVVSPPGSSERR